MNPIIRIENLHQEFDKVVVLDDINLEIKQGEIVSIVGPLQNKIQFTFFFIFRV